nr:MAG TPA: hypothetical protein [Caudoviricetes sp.]
MFKIISTVLNLLTFGIFKQKSNDGDSLFKKLIKDNNNYSVGNFFLIVLTMVAILLLMVPMSLLIEMLFNKTIVTDLNGMAAYILAVVSLLGIGGGTFGWVEWSKNKYSGTDDSTDNVIVVDNTTDTEETVQDKH